MSRTTLTIFAGVGAVAVLAACSSSHKAASPTTAAAVQQAPSSAAAGTSAPADPPTSRAVAAKPVAAADGLTGTWSGQYSGSYHGTFRLTWQESGSTLTGSIHLSAPDATLNINGTVQGARISFGTVGSFGITYSGSVSGHSMSGSYQVQDGTGSGGPWSAAKT